MGSATVLYVGTNEGVVSLKSEDGRQWDVQSQGLKSWAVPQLEVQTSQPNRVFAGTRGDGVWGRPSPSSRSPLSRRGYSADSSFDSLGSGARGPYARHNL